ncbi:hypothetical protein Hanom_Chr07g00583441 [Helianthus anomalus]
MMMICISANVDEYFDCMSHVSRLSTSFLFSRAYSNSLAFCSRHGSYIATSCSNPTGKSWLRSSRSR